MADLKNFEKDILEKVFHFYELEHSSLVEMDQLCPVKTVRVDLATIDESNMRLRHSEKNLGKFFSTLEI
jgi:hypothetical protein